MADFLLELLSEEIPARMQEKASADLARMFGDELAKAGLKPESLTSYVTPRRLALIARGLPLETAAVSEEIKGPKSSAPPQALEGFLRKTGLTADQLVERDGTLFAVIAKPGRATAEVLADAIPAIVRAFPWPKSMRWGTASRSTSALRWVRPLQGVVALLGDDVVPLEIDGLISGAATVGHRFHHPGIITIGNADDYEAKLRACHVIVDPAERRDMIRARAAELAAEAGLSVVPDEGLVAENAGLTEWPVPLLGHFDPAFLEVPREVIQLTLRTNQKYFVLNDAAGQLAPAFICTANITAKDGGVGIVAGNGKVLAARLSDAKFFWEQDLKIPLAEQAKKLDQIIFHEKLGTVANKVGRVAKLAHRIGGAGSSGLDPSWAEDARTAASLAKADLVTGMVGEFPELQGVMGGYYAREQGLSPAVSDAIRDHYKPVGQGDDVPMSPVSIAVALSDKIDTLVAFFAVNERPTGSKDPFALRRAMLGVLRIAIENNLSLPLEKLLVEQLRTLSLEAGDRAMRAIAGKFDINAPGMMEEMDFSEKERVISYRGQIFPLPDDIYFPLHLFNRVGREKENIAADIITFAIDRLKVQQREAGIRHDLIDAVFALGGEDDLVRLLARVKALQAFVETEDGANLLAGYKRAANILKKEAPKGVAPAEAGAAGDGASTLSQELGAASASAGATDWGYEPEPAELALKVALDAAESKATAGIEAEDFAAAMSALASLRRPIDAFFDKVTVNDPIADKRNTRLALLEKIRVAVHNVADFSKIEG